MRLIREITAEEENAHLEPIRGTEAAFIKVNPVEAEPIGTIVLLPFKVAGYDPDADGSLMARLEMMSLHDDFEEGPDPDFKDMDLDRANTYAGILTHMGLYPTSGFVVTPKELAEMKRVAEEA